MFKAGAIEHWNETDASIQYSLFEPTEKCTTVSRSSADGHSSTLSVGFRSTPGIPIFAQNELSRQFYDEISADARDHLIKKHGYDHHFASDPLGRRMNICGGYLDLTTHRFRGVVDRATIKLLFVTGHVTICDISRKTYQQVADLPGIGPKRIFVIETRLAEYGLRFATYKELNDESIFGGAGFSENLASLSRNQKARSRREAFRVITNSRHPDAEQDYAVCD